jgi:hypothetical protein
LNNLNLINNKLSAIIESNERILEINQALLENILSKQNHGENEIHPNSKSLLSLPKTLRKTALVLYKLERATADDLAKETNRMRAVESAAANELFRLGFIKKKRDGREVYFYIESVKEYA